MASTRRSTLMTAVLGTLSSEQSAIEIAIRNMNTPMAPSLVTGYIAAAQTENTKRKQEKNEMMDTMRNEVASSIAQIATRLRTENNNTYIAVQTEMKGLSSAMKILADSHGSLNDDVAYTRHELTAMGEKITSLNHLITSRNKELLTRIENLENSLKTPPPKKTIHWSEYILVISILIAMLWAIQLQTKKDMLMLGY
jgi:hypothetical protein